MTDHSFGAVAWFKGGLRLFQNVMCHQERLELVKNHFLQSLGQEWQFGDWSAI